MRKIEQCPNCGNYTEGQVEYTTAQKVVKYGAKQAVGSAFKWIGGILGLTTVAFTGPFGPILGFVIGWVIDAANASAKDSAADALVRSGSDSMKYNFNCPCCGQTWSRFFQDGEDTIPDAVLEREKIEVAKAIRGTATSSWAKLIINGAITFGCIYYCCNNNSTYMTKGYWFIDPHEATSYGWWFMLIIAIFFGIFVLNNIIAIINIMNNASNVENMPTSEYRNSECRYTFRPLIES